jgi:hypothetical protein
VVVGAPALTRALAAAALAACAAVSSARAAPDGFAVDARCHDGRAQGPYQLRDARGQLRASGAFDGGVRTGSFIFWRANGLRAAHVPYDDNGVRRGTVAMWYDGDPRHEAVQRLESAWRRGRREGEMRAWYPDGRRRARADFTEGRLVKAEAWSQTGTRLPEDDARRVVLDVVREAETEYGALDALIRRHMPPC